MSQKDTPIIIKNAVFLEVETREKSGLMPVLCQLNFKGNKPVIIQVWQNQQLLQKHELKPGDNDLLFFANVPRRGHMQPLTLVWGEQTLAIKQLSSSYVTERVNLVQHTHTDIGYTRPQSDILAEHLRIIDFALDYCDLTDGYPEEAKFRWTCEVTWPVEKYLLSRPPRQIERLKKRVSEGRIELAGMYLNFNELPDEQTLAASLAPISKIRENGLPVKVAMQNDVNGIGWCFVDYFSSIGIRYLTMGTHGYRALIPFDTPTAFWWESPSGNRLLSYRSEHYHQGNFFGLHTGDFDLFERNLLIYLYELQIKGYPYDITSIQFSGYHTDNSPPSLMVCDLVRKWNQKYSKPKLSTATTFSFFDEIESQYGEKLEVLRAAWPDWWTDGFGSGAREVSKVRTAHSDIIAAQQAFSMAKMLGQPLPENFDRDVFLANDAINFYDEHTFGFHASIRDPWSAGSMEQRAMKESFAWEAHRRSKLLVEESLGLLQEHVNRQDVPVISVFNTLPWERSSLVRVFIDEQQLPRSCGFFILDEQGNEIPAQVVEAHRGGAYYQFWSDKVPSFGWKTYRIIVDENSKRSSPLIIKPEFPVLENDWYSIKIDTVTGAIVTLTDKQLNQDLVDKEAPWGFGEIIYERLKDRNEITKGHLVERKFPDLKWVKNYERIKLEAVKFKGIRDNAVWNEAIFTGKLEMAAYGSEGFRLSIRLYNTTKRIDFAYSVVKRPVSDPEAIYVAFPFKIKDFQMFFDVQGGTIEAGAGQIPGSSNDWNTVQNVVTIKNKDTQIVIGSHEAPLFQLGGINSGRYQAGEKPQKPYVMGWPMNNYWITNFAVDQRGEFEWVYYFTSGEVVSIDSPLRFGWNARVPLLGRVVLPGVSHAMNSLRSLMDEFPHNVLLVNAKPLQSQNSVILHLRETNGEATSFLPSGMHRFVFKEVDVLGDFVCDIDKISLKPGEIKFIKMSWD